MTTRLPRRGLLAAALTLPVVAACTREPDPKPSSPTPPPATDPDAAPDAAPSDGHDEWEYTTPTPDVKDGDEAQADSLMNPEATDEDEAGAIAAALTTAEIWVQGSTLDQEEWNSALMETMTELAQNAYDGRWWGYRIAATEITGDPTTVFVTASSATIRVPTNDGDLTITVVRESPDSPWLTSGLETEGQA